MFEKGLHGFALGSTTRSAGYFDKPLAPVSAVLAGSIGVLAAMGTAHVFYACIPAMLAAAPFGLVAIPIWRARCATRRRERFEIQFQDMLFFLSSSLSAGKSTESAFVESADYLGAQYGRERTELLAELQLFSGKLALREPIERLLADLARRTELDDIRILSEVISISKRSGGNLVEVIQQSVRVLREKMGIRREMETAWASKKLEQRILGISPVLMILMLRGGTDSFMAPMYETLTGRLVMTLALMMIVAGYWLGAHMMRQRI